MINVVTLLHASTERAGQKREGLFGPEPVGPSRAEITRDLLRQLAKHDGDPATAGLRDEDDDQWIVDDHLKALAHAGLAEVAERVEVCFYRITDAGIDVLKALDGRPPFVA